MGFQHRKLTSGCTNETSTTNCDFCYDYCRAVCYEFCPGFCSFEPDPSYVHQYPPPPPPTPLSDSKKLKTFVIITSTLLVSTFLALCCLVYYARRRSNARRRRSLEAGRDEFVDEDHGPIVDHPIWYINTVGLQSSIIRSIAVCKYKRGEGLVERTECCVCLNEFQEDETLRLLPNCSHAFHISCIDNWLRSHTNCPMSRAPIVSNAGNRGPSSSSEDSGGAEETQVVAVEESERGTDGGTSEIEEMAVENEGTEDGIQPMRRPVSLDSMAASQISHGLVNGNGNSDNELGKGNK
ncbi:putative HXXXD-type acyl-transferase family protein [Hibiscus syriacus]|uniref:RING-type E3 ubiquitin transferase n=1 Tax=Hibiscus syriacus TaxID=106335 RepID=A0A6A3B7Z0_HIBSY|nr:RING-H2 finger protein ATL54-like [Hibiscus syriacus]KAE8712926.1 putative HXXXD-type acyl-transferase family protein [Hibiscus syriacus]